MSSLNSAQSFGMHFAAVSFISAPCRLARHENAFPRGSRSFLSLLLGVFARSRVAVRQKREKAPREENLGRSIREIDFHGGIFCSVKTNFVSPASKFSNICVCYTIVSLLQSSVFDTFSDKRIVWKKNSCSLLHYSGLILGREICKKNSTQFVVQPRRTGKIH